MRRAIWCLAIWLGLLAGCAGTKDAVFSPAEVAGNYGYNGGIIKMYLALRPDGSYQFILGSCFQPDLEGAGRWRLAGDKIILKDAPASKVRAEHALGKILVLPDKGQIVLLPEPAQKLRAKEPAKGLDDLAFHRVKAGDFMSKKTRKSTAVH